MIIVHKTVLVKDFLLQGGYMKNKLTDFGKKIKCALVEMDATQDWLIAEVKNKTGLYFDSSYLSKIMTGKKRSEKVVTAINEILFEGETSA